MTPRGEAPHSLALRPPPRWVLVFVGVTLVVAAILFVLSAAEYEGPWWLLLGAPALPLLKLASAVFPALSDAGSYVATAVLYGFLASVWYMPLRGKWKALLLVISVLYFSVAVLVFLVALLGGNLGVS